MYTIDGEHYISSLETAHKLGITHATLRTYRSDRRPHIPFTKISGAVLYRLRDVEAFIRGRAGR
jgi:hypothetical protein